MTPEQIRELFAFDGDRDSNSSTVSPQAKLQSEGVASLWYLLREKGYGYLADEVGMGKTRQAMAIIALQFLIKPDSRVVIVCPGEALQKQWVSEWDLFVRQCIRPLDFRLRTEHCLVEAPVRPLPHDRLHSFVQALLLDEQPLHLLRYSSFSRPIGFRSCQDPDDVSEYYRRCLQQVGITDIGSEETSLIEAAWKHKRQNTDPSSWRPELTQRLNSIYVGRIRPLIGNRNIDLIVFDEAQYLRHTGNRQNTHIRTLFTSQNIGKWLFLSATPLHTSEQDIFSLDNYLCTRYEPAKDLQNACIPCKQPTDATLCSDPGCAQLHYRHDNQGIDIIDLMKEFVVRRTRQYTDARGTPYSKNKYRYYKKSPVDISEDPFYALTSALVQKHLVSALAGNNNRFRQGECSSFESLASSVVKPVENSDGNQESKELENGDNPSDALRNTTLDRFLIDGLNTSFQEAMGPLLGRDNDKTLSMPHAKLGELVDRLDATCLRNGSNHKSLVFVRRLATVDELLVQLNGRLQREIDRRLGLWRDWLDQHKEYQHERLVPGNFWQPTTETTNEDGDDEDESLSPDLGRAEKLPYFEALRPKKGFLSRFSERLQRKDRSPFGWLLAHDSPESEYWHRLVDVLCSGKTPAPDWLCQEYEPEDDRYWSLATLKLCILQTLRRSDFLVDLYVLDRFVTLPSSGREDSLSDKLLALLKEDALPLDSDLRQLSDNWRTRLRNWCDHFELIRDKSLRSGRDERPEDIYHNVPQRFRGASPILGRSGRIQNALAVPQFKMPGSPNILICTDVLKEGVDMHLFCDEIIHYGVAWTSGDLEQRIGRVDRFGSLYQRKISSFRPIQNNRDYPRMKVDFPYLQGTLDEWQVNRVVRDKLINDQRMDLGRRKGEIEMDVNALCLSSPADTPEGQASPPEFFSSYQPADQDWNTIQQKVEENELHDQVGQMCECLAVKRNDRSELHYLPKLGLLRVRDKKWTLFKFALIGKTIDCQALETVMSAIETDHGIHGAFGAVQAPSIFGDEWRFDHDWQTLYREVEIDAPFNQTDKRTQEVIIERTNSCWLLRSPIAPVSEGDVNRSLDWLAQQNDRRPFGQIVLDRDILWLEQPLYSPEQADLLKENIEELTIQVARTADRFQQLYLGGDDPKKWAYHAGRTLSSALIDDFQPLMLSQGDSIIMQTDLKLQTRHGESLSLMQRWILDAYEQTLAALARQQEYADEDIQELTEGIDGLFETGGVIKLIMPNQVVRFRLSLFLDLAPSSSEPGQEEVFHGPRIAWELCVPATEPKGPVPKLGSSDYAELPHNAPEEWVHIDVNPSSHSVHAVEVDQRRYLVLYHRADLLDQYRERLIQCWGWAIESMQKSKFMRKDIARWFGDVLSEDAE